MVCEIGVYTYDRTGRYPTRVPASIEHPETGPLLVLYIETVKPSVRPRGGSYCVVLGQLFENLFDHVDELVNVWPFVGVDLEALPHHLAYRVADGLVGSAAMPWHSVKDQEKKKPAAAAV